MPNAQSKVEMRKLFLSLGAIAATGLLWYGVPCNQAVAISGCCKERVGDNRWRNIGNDFARCKELNKIDKDDIFQPSKKYWWDVGC